MIMCKDEREIRGYWGASSLIRFMRLSFFMPKSCQSMSPKVWFLMIMHRLSAYHKHHLSSSSKTTPMTRQLTKPTTPTTNTTLLIEVMVNDTCCQPGPFIPAIFCVCMTWRGVYRGGARIVLNRLNLGKLPYFPSAKTCVSLCSAR